jgi:hypothetical protein
MFSKNYEKKMVRIGYEKKKIGNENLQERWNKMEIESYLKLCTTNKVFFFSLGSFPVKLYQQKNVSNKFKKNRKAMYIVSFEINN